MRQLTLHWTWNGEHHSHTVKTGGQVVVGRRSDSNIVLALNTVSRQHGLIYSELGEFKLRNLSRVNPIRVGSNKSLNYQESAPLASNDTFQIGPVRFTVSVKDVDSVTKIRCANCGRIQDYDPTGFCPWCGMALAAGQTVIDIE